MVAHGVRCENGTRKRGHYTACFNGGIDGRKDSKRAGVDSKSKVLKLLRLTVSHSVRVGFELHPGTTSRLQFRPREMIAAKLRNNTVTDSHSLYTWLHTLYIVDGGFTFLRHAG